MLKYFTIRHEVCELKKTFCRNVFIKKCVFNSDYPIYIYIYIYINYKYKLININYKIIYIYYKRLIWLRNIDVIFFTWTHNDEQKLERFLKDLLNFTLKLNLTHEASKNCIPF